MMLAQRKALQLTEGVGVHRVLAVGVVLCSLLLCATVTSESALGVAPLPDGRAWEMVSPLEKNGGEINGINGVTPDEGLPEGGVVQASVDGNLITYLSLLAFPDSNHDEPKAAPLASQYLSTREANGWLTNDIAPRVNSGTYSPAGSGAPYRAFSSDLLQGLMQSGSPGPIENPPLTEDAPPRYENYYVRNNGTGAFVEALLTKEMLLAIPPLEPPNEFFLELVGATPDLQHTVLRTKAALSVEATKQLRRNLYEWADTKPGHLQPINVLPEAGISGETASGGALLGMGGDESHTISSDGSRVFWSQPESERLFVRENLNIGQPKTLQIDASRGGEDLGGHGEFKTASSDGSKVFFTDENRLTPGSTAGRENAHEDLYMFNVNTEQLSDLTIDEHDPAGASVLGVLGASEDGSYIYFVAEGHLSSTVTGNDNLYVWHELEPGKGTTAFIGTLSSGDLGPADFHEPVIAHDWTSSTAERTTRVTADGRYLVFMSDANLTGYNNYDLNTDKPDEEVYLYNANSNVLTCVSCNPGDTRPIGPSGIPGGTAWNTIGRGYGTYQSRVLSIDGSRVFFDSRDALVPQDTNDVQDVYEWEAGGSGSCQKSDGCIYMLSGGMSVSDSSFVDASTSGNDAFFVTRAQLVSGDTDQLRDLYDARVGGGFVSPPVVSPACEGESCLPPSSSLPSLGSPASATFIGVGNLAPSLKSVTKAKATKRDKAKKLKKHTGKKKRRNARAGRGRGSRLRGRL